MVLATLESRFDYPMTTDTPRVIQDQSCYICEQKCRDLVDTRIGNDYGGGDDNDGEEEAEDDILSKSINASEQRARTCTTLESDWHGKADRGFLSRHRTYSERLMPSHHILLQGTDTFVSSTQAPKLLYGKNKQSCTPPHENRLSEDGDNLVGPDPNTENKNNMLSILSNNNNNNILHAKLSVEKESGGHTDLVDLVEREIDVFMEAKDEALEVEPYRRERGHTMVNVATARKGLFSKDKLLTKRKRSRSKLISNAGNPLWTSVDNCRWKSANGRVLELKATTLFSLGEPERSMVKQLSFAKLQAFDLRCHLSYPKEGNTVRKTWKQLLSLKKKITLNGNSLNEKESKRNRSIFSIPIAQVVANENAVAASQSLDKERQKRSSESGPRRDRCSTLAIEAIVARSQSFHSECGDGQSENNVVMDSISRLIASRKEFTSLEDGLQTRRQSRLIDALSLSSSTASSLCILDRDTELAPSPPQIPAIVVQSVEYLEKHGLNVLGIFRNGGSKKRVRKMREDFDHGKEVIFDKETQPHDVAALLKEFFRDLPDPLLTRELYKAFIGTRRIKDPETRKPVMKYLARLLPVVNRDSLKMLLDLLDKVARRAEDKFEGETIVFEGNKMDTRNLATLIGPNILHNIKMGNAQLSLTEDGFSAEENQLMIDVVKEMIELNGQLFEVSAREHDEVLQNVMETDPESVDYVLKKKASMTKPFEITVTVEEDIEKKQLRSQKHARSMSCSTTRSRFSDEIRYFLSRAKRSSEDNSALQATRQRKNSATIIRPGSLRAADENEPPKTPRKALSANSSFCRPTTAPDAANGNRDFTWMAERNHVTSKGRDSGVDMQSVTLQATSEDDTLVRLRVDSNDDCELNSSGRFRRSLTRSSGRGSRWERDSAYESGRSTLCRLPSIPGDVIQTTVVSEEKRDVNALLPDKPRGHGQELKYSKSVDITSAVPLSDVLDKPSFVMPNQKRPETRQRNTSLPGYSSDSLPVPDIRPLHSPNELRSSNEGLKWAEWQATVDLPGQETDL